MYLLLAFLTVSLAAAAPWQLRTTNASASCNYTSLVVFGDSFSDNGNEYRLSNESWPSNPNYFGGRFSNGLVWNEDLAQNLSLPLHNYAYGGATTSNKLVQGYSGESGDIPVPSIDEQVNTYLSSIPPDTSIETALIAILGGANDVLFDFNITAIQSVGVISGVVTQLRNAGAQNFVFLNYPDLSVIPYDSYIPLFTQMQLRQFSADLSTQLTSLTSSISASGRSPTMPTSSAPVSATFVDLLPLFQTFSFYEGGWKAVGFDQFGLYGSCLVGAYLETDNVTLCDNPDQQVFWDEYHPTKVSHKLISDAIMFALEV